MVALESSNLLHRILAGLQTSWKSSFRLRLLFKELLSALGIALQSWRALLDSYWQGLLVLPGIQGEGEGGADGDWELEFLALAGQAWQKSMHLVAKEELSPLEAAVIVECYFWTMKNGSSWIDMLAFRVENEWGDPAGGGRNEEAVAGQDGGERESKETFPFTYRIGGPRQGQCSIQVKGMVPQFFAIALISYFG